MLASCAPIGPVVPSTQAESPVSAQAPDPTRSIYFSWDPIDRAVVDGAIEYLVVATPIRAVEPRERRYRLLASKDQPGELVILRGDDDGRFAAGTRSLTITARVGRFGNAALESAIVNEITRRLEDSARQAADQATGQPGD